MLVNISQLAEFDNPAYNLDGFWISAEELEQMTKKRIPEAEVEYDPDSLLSFQLKSWSMMKGDDSLIKEQLDFKIE